MPSRAAVAKLSIPATTGAKGARGARGQRGGTATAKIPGAAEKKEIPRFDDLRFRGMLDELDEIGCEVRGWQADIKELQDKINDKRVVAQALMETIDDGHSWSVSGDEWEAVYVKPIKEKKKIVAELLLSQGIPQAKIDKATKKTPPGKPYVQIRAKGEKQQYGSDEED